MAGKKSYAGIEIEFSANYNDLVKGLSEIDAMSNKLDKDLKTAQKALKLDPENTELMAAAQRTLASAVENTTKRLEMLKSTEAEIKQQYESGAMPIEQYIKFQSELSKTEAALDKYTKMSQNTNIIVDELSVGLEKAEVALKDYREQAELLSKTGDKTAIYDIEQAIADTTAKIEDYKARIQALISENSGLMGAQNNLKTSTKELTDAQNEATSSAAKMSEGYSTTKAIIADLASTVIKKTANSLIDFAKGSIEAASALYEVENVVDVAFEDMRGKVDEFAATSIETYGISELTAKRTAALFTSMGKAMDLTLDKASDLAIGLAQRSADMASFYDMSQDITSTALKSVFTGETESLKRFGVVMTEANLQQYAFSQGIEKSIRDMTQAEKVQLRYNYLMQQTAAAGGDFARTSDSFANKTRQLKERLTETSIVIGNKFIKNLDGAFNTLDDLLKKVKEMGENGELDEIIKDISDILKNLLKILSTLSTVLLKFPKLTTTAAAGFMAFNKVGKIAEKTDVLNKSLGELIPKFGKAGTTAAGAGEKFTMSAGAIAAAGTAIIALELALADYFDTLAEKARNANKLSDELQKLVDESAEYQRTVKENIQARQKSIDTIDAEYGSYRELANKLTELSNQTKKSSSDINEMTTIADQLNEGMAGLGLEIDSTTGAMNMQAEELLDLIGAYEKYYKAQAALEAMQETLKDQYAAQAKVNANIKERAALSEKEAEASIRASEAKNQYYAIYNKWKKSYGEQASEVEEVQEYYKAWKDAEREAGGIRDEINILTQKYHDYNDALEESTFYYDELNGIYDDVKGDYDDIEKRIESASDAADEQTETLKKLSDAYKKAESAISSYKSEISDLINVQKELNEGTQYSTTQIMDIIDKYPELIGYIKKTEKGYTLEKEALESLVKIKAQNLELSSKQAAELKRQELVTNGLSTSWIGTLEKEIDHKGISNVAKVQAGEYTEDLQEYIRLYAKSKGIGDLYTDIISEGFKEGEKVEAEAAEKTAKTVAKTTEKATKQEAETLIEIYKHRYAQGIIDAETYYNKLDEIAKKYYANEGGYLERYMELEDEAQAGIKKAIEDKAKNYQNLKDKIEGVTEARKKLLGIESNKNVLAYQEATGFRLEANQSDIAAATKTLADAKTQLMQALTDISGDTNVYRALAQKLAAVTGEALENVLPELTTEESVPTTKNYTFNFGDIISNGDGAALKKLLNDFVNSVINETQII